MGDDRTDEDAFRVSLVFIMSALLCSAMRRCSKGKLELQALKERNCGYGILVSSVAKESSAAYSLRDPSEVPNSSFKANHFRYTWRKSDMETIDGR